MNKKMVDKEMLDMIKQNMNKYYFTFGDEQLNGGCYVEIESENYFTAREEMVKRYGTKWAFEYDEKEWNLDPTNKHHVEMAEFYNRALSKDNPISQAELFSLTKIE